MPFDSPDITALNVGLDEAVVEGVQWDPATAQARVLVQVLSLPPDAPTETDSRRQVVLSRVSDVEVLLRRDRAGAVDYGPPIPVPDQHALDRFFASLAVADAMHGGRTLDDASPTDDWPRQPSLTLGFRPRPAGHCLYWFTNCARPEAGGMVGYRLEGLIRFEDVTVQRADGTPVSPDAFADAARRWWTARYQDDPRVSPRAQREQHRPSWRDGAGSD